MKDTPYPSPINIRLPLDVKASLQQLAEADGRSLSNYLNKLLRDHVEAQRKGGSNPR